MSICFLLSLFSFSYFSASDSTKHEKYWIDLVIVYFISSNDNVFVFFMVLALVVNNNNPEWPKNRLQIYAKY